MASEGQQTKMPNKDTYIEFEKHNTKLPCPFVKALGKALGKALESQLKPGYCPQNAAKASGKGAAGHLKPG